DSRAGRVDAGRWTPGVTLASRAPALAADGRGAEEDEAVRGRVHGDGVALLVLTLQHRQRDRVGQLALDHPLERPGPEVRVVADPGDVLAARPREDPRRNAPTHTPAEIVHQTV